MSKNIYKAVFVMAVFVLSVGLCHGQEDLSMGADDLFSLGNNFYEKGEYDKAISEYEKIIDMGKQSGAIYYNLAGAYFRTGRIGKAIQNYERAKRLLPRDADISSNLRFADNMVKGRVIAGKNIWDLPIIKRYSSILTLNEIIWATVLIYMLMLILAALSVKIISLRRSAAIVILLLFAFAVFNITIAVNKIEYTNNTAITVVPDADAYFGPFESATKFFSLQEGMKVKIVKTKDGWYKIKRADGKVGWLKSGEIERI